MDWQNVTRLHLAASTGNTRKVVPLKWDQIPESMQTLVRRMKVDLDTEVPVEIAPSWLGARAVVASLGGRGSRIQLGGELVARLSPEALDGVMAHELAHIKCRHWQLLLAGSTLAALSAIAIGLLVELPLPFRLLLGSGILILAAAALSWIAEYEADSIAARYVGYDVVAQLLLELRDSRFRTRPEFTHPSDSSRMRQLTRAWRRHA